MLGDTLAQSLLSLSLNQISVRLDNYLNPTNPNHPSIHLASFTL